MVNKPSLITEQDIHGFDIPDYSSVSHASIIGQIQGIIEETYPIVIINKHFNATADKDILYGSYVLQVEDKPPFVFEFSNSYKKLNAFDCSIGGYALGVSTPVSYHNSERNTCPQKISRLTYALELIRDTLNGYSNSIESMDKDIAIMDSLNLSRSKVNEILGSVYSEHETLSSSQLILVQKEIKRLSKIENIDNIDAWSFYNILISSLDQDHPANKLNNLRKLHSIYLELIQKRSLNSLSSTIVELEEMAKTSIEGAKQTNHIIPTTKFVDGVVFM